MRSRGILVTNPNATTSAGWNRDVLVRALEAEVDLEIKFTERRGHASEIAAQARRDGINVVFTLGGDGTVNEVINGLLSVDSASCPLLGTIPGGLANVFPRSLGFSADAMAASGELIEAYHAGSTRLIPLGNLNGRWFAFNAGIGLDAAVVHAVEESRAQGKKASAGKYLVATLRKTFEGMADRRPQLSVTARLADGSKAEVERAFMVVVQNTAPWSFAGPVAVELAAEAAYDRGLSLVALTSLNPAVMAAFLAEGAARLPADRRSASTVLEDCAEIEVRAAEPMPAQVDGDAIGSLTRAEIRQFPDMIRVIVPR